MKEFTRSRRGAILPTCRYAVARRRARNPPASRCRKRRAVTVFDKPRAIPGQVYWHNFKMQFPTGRGAGQNAARSNLEGIEKPLARRLKKLKRKFSTSTAKTGTLTPTPGRDDQSDADLVPTDGAEKVFTIPDPAES